MSLSLVSFMAYKSEDRQTANKLQAIFEAQQLSVFIDSSFIAGEHFSMKLEPVVRCAAGLGSTTITAAARTATTTNPTTVTTT